MIAVACHLEMNVDVVVRLVMFYGTLNIILPWLGDTLWLSKVLISLGDGHIGYEFSALEVLFFPMGVLRKHCNIHVATVKSNNKTIMAFI